ncbi:MAG: ornithine carbamoyltransferase, partial [Desulfurococcaceae archaeon]
MVSSLKGRHCLTLTEFNREEIWFIIDTAFQLKQRYLAGERIIPVLTGRPLAMIFEKPST